MGALERSPAARRVRVITLKLAEALAFLECGRP